ncbi:hypothetical protein IWW34DRAFT_731973 [Fusarium oxysporum f. sp. albedinis]|uniref:Uncharacterized protein n=4 Tax=Fusarium oxysporum TaxID=5507 RepID=A0A420PS64_FUSOX|nr:uncharacterized protein FOBCDRAFT_29415 [Fusarium oxysporum Fo47]EXL59575.1 hypothetical protein FOCG_02762 [Fusarium oxysporum f. sp. radicis-lycopersici 26381]KAF5268587.1 hypothetical protein FOXYS1_519 [Fusarium oxysporum]KAI3582658.1 hypothetical protein IWW34DRAFT_731973 [Fusarium oxysporum f. sp. albedinis]PCD43867.1 hypothetical protein AU210_002955 [Fusarium oxysporum f. sp. radicis-cucumerinum]RKK17954.1 hypothetical protein BFJ65_g8273 [Fusarium oxysporum f. sp. cepae]
MAESGSPGWKWFPNVKANWSLDVVTLLAVIGESSMAEQTQTITASLLCLLPRLIPAPQALLKPSRPSRMPETLAKMTGVYSGTTLDSVGFFATIITPLDALQPFSFRVLEITHTDPSFGDIDMNPPSAQESWSTRSLKWVKSRRSSFHNIEKLSNEKDSQSNRIPRAPHVEEGGLPLPNTARTTTFRPPGDSSPSNADTPRPLVRRPTAKQKVQDMLANPTFANTKRRPAVPAKLFSPIHILSVFSCLLSIAIIICAVVWQDGNAILAVSLISFASTVVGYASFWHPILMNRKHTNEVPRGDVMIRTREGAFLLIKCTEEVARELYSGTEECHYHVGGRTYRLLMALGTTLLMLSVVLLGNCTWNSQIFIGGSYIVLNGLYWGLGMLPRSYFWDLSRYQWQDVTPEDAKNADEITDVNDQREGYPSFTRTLWFAIRETQLTGWVGRSGAAPGTRQWNKWLKEALQNAKNGNRSWDSVARKDAIMKESLSADEIPDEAAQHAPAVEVQNSPTEKDRTTF